MCPVKTNPLHPQRLQPGDCIAVAAPASPFDLKKFESGLQILDRMGFELKVPWQIFKKNGYLAGSDHRRADLLMSQFKDPSVKAIFCARGGFGSLRILEGIDWACIRENPKLVVGFSDITALLLALWQRAGLVCIHGPVVTSLAEVDGDCIDSLKAALMGERSVSLASTEPRTIRGGLARGTVAGGNLTTLCHLLATDYEPDLTDTILFLEDRGEAPYRIDRMLTQMKLAGCFEKISGLMLGRFDECGDEADIFQRLDQLVPEDVPIVGGFPVGHAGNNHTVVVGLSASLDADRGVLHYGRCTTVDPQPS